MQELIKITVDQNGSRLVSARELHNHLDASERFASWFERQLQFGFIENQDYTGVKVLTPVNNGAKIELQDYALTLDCAKEISMVQRTEKGKEARQYFIECERMINNPALPTTFISALERLLVEVKANEQLQLQNDLQSKELKAAAPKVKYVNEVLSADNTHTTTIIAKELGMSAAALNNTLRNKGIQFQQNGTWVLYSRYQDKGYTKTRTSTYTDSNGATHTSILTVWTETGRAFIHHALSQQKKTA